MLVNFKRKIHSVVTFILAAFVMIIVAVLLASCDIGQGNTTNPTNPTGSGDVQIQTSASGSDEPYIITPEPSPSGGTQTGETGNTDVSTTPTPTTTTPTPIPTTKVVEGWTGAPDAPYTVELDPTVEYWDCPISEVGQIFFHCLVSYPELELAITPNSSFHDWCNTVPEFEKLLQSIYERDYILINMNYVYEYREHNGTMKAFLKDSIKLPKGKKGMILSVDNVCYPDGEEGRGRCDKLVIYNGKLATYTKHKDGREEYSYDNEVFPILESFCEQHPDFSFAGARCMLAVSASYGLLGYRTADSYAAKGYDVEAERLACAEVIAYLKNNGFYFGCHSYYHLDIPTMSINKLNEEFELWNKEAKSLIGYTPIYVYPSGAVTKYGTEQHNKLLEEGFHVFCSTQMDDFMRNGMLDNRNAGDIYTTRFIFCGRTMVKYPQMFDKYCDVYEVYDNEGRYIKLYRPASSSSVADNSTVIPTTPYRREEETD